MHRSGSHSFSKFAEEAVTLVPGLGVHGDAHSGSTVQHRSRVARDASQPNLRQVHLLHAELFEELMQAGFAVCKYKQRLPVGWVDFMFSVDPDKGIFELADRETRRALSDEQVAFALAVFRHEPLQVISGAARDVVLHGSGDAIVPFEGSGARTHYAIEGSELVVIEDAPHGFNTSHAEQFNKALITFLKD